MPSSCRSGVVAWAPVSLEQAGKLDPGVLWLNTVVSEVSFSASYTTNFNFQLSICSAVCPARAWYETDWMLQACVTIIPSILVSPTGNSMSKTKVNSFELRKSSANSGELCLCWFISTGYLQTLRTYHGFGHWRPRRTTPLFRQAQRSVRKGGPISHSV